jgi:hypothetical protein
MNPVVGNASLIAKFGSDTHITLTEVERIRCHLEYVFGQISSTPTNNEQRTRTMKNLQQYIENSQFPSHEDVSNQQCRKPCFIDSTGRACAVAHLLQTSGEMKLALAINNVHQHSTISEIAADPKFSQPLTDWQIRSGLSLDELALIQPTYEFVAREARNKFDELMAKMHSIIDAPDRQEEQKHALARNAIVFGDTMKSGFGWPYKDTPVYLKTLDDFEEKLLLGGDNAPSSSDESKNVVLRQLVNLLRLEVIRDCTADDALYATLLSEDDFRYMKTTIVSNRRVPHC